ncbi:MAG: glucose 1-dehydrogenase [Actinomycetota bacterium]|nr:glucose 1-dehydrogenase [Actinomycetota bacterium]
MAALDRFRLDGRVALVTGAGKGIGAEIATVFAEAGADVAIVARTVSDLDEVAATIEKQGRRALVVPADVMDAAALPVIASRTAQKLGGIDILVNNAGGAIPQPFMDTHADGMDWAFRFNVSSPMEMTRLAVPHMLERGNGVVLNVGSMAGIHASRGYLAYGTAKAALAHATKLSASDLAPRIRVNAIAPGAVETSALKWYLGYMDEQGTPIRETMMERTLLQRNGVPGDVATAALFLCSDASSWVTGKVLEVDGGWAFELLPRTIPDL